MSSRESMRKGYITKLEDDRDRYRAALELLADPENWSGNPESMDAWLFGHLTPFEIAREALEGTPDA